MISKYLRLRRKGDHVAIFHELHPDPLYCSLQQWEQFVGGQADTSLESGLKERGLMVSSPEDDQREYECASEKLLKKHRQASILYLMTAQGCNLSCKYCLVPDLARKFGESMLSEDDAIAGIDLWYEHLKDVCDPDTPHFVIFYGGEPLLNLQTIRTSLTHLDSKVRSTGLPRKLNLMIVTNGLLVDNEVVALCKDRGIMVVVSIDGPRQVHDSMRTGENGSGSYDAATNAVRKLVAAGVRTFGSVTVAPHNMDRLSEVAKTLKDLKVEGFGFNFVKGKHLIELVGKDGVDRYCEQATKAVLRFARTVEGGSDYQLEKKRAAFVSGDFFPHDCTCYGSQLVIQPDGQISNCPFFKACMGHVGRVDKGFRVWNQSLVTEWRKRLPLFSQGYKNNDAKALCGAGCAWSSQELYGDILAVDQSSRIFSEEVFDELIWSKQQ